MCVCVCVILYIYYMLIAFVKLSHSGKNNAITSMQNSQVTYYETPKETSTSAHGYNKGPVF